MLTTNGYFNPLQESFPDIAFSQNSMLSLKFSLWDAFAIIQKAPLDFLMNEFLFRNTTSPRSLDLPPARRETQRQIGTCIRSKDRIKIPMFGGNRDPSNVEDWITKYLVKAT
eukprot:Gb_26244 [translate_table: standard]